MLLLCLVGIAAADDWVGGLPLTTVQNGTVTGDLYINATPAPDWGNHVVNKTFTLPATAVAGTGRIKWARLYISAYCGIQEADNAFTITNKWDGNGDSAYDTTWAETGHAAYIFIKDGGNDNSAFAGHSTGESYKMINNHENRVTSDYFMWYDVTSLINGQTINVNVDTTGSSDGRIKMITLVVAYDDPASTKQTKYWVNQGHDVCSYWTEENYGTAAVGSTTFGTTGLSGITSANLTVDYLASNNGYYGFPTAANDFTYTGGTPPVEGTFTNALDRVADVQGTYSGLDSWDVTSSVTGSSDVTLGYSRYFPGIGTSAYYKIPLAVLVVKSPLPDLTISGLVNTVPASAVFAKEPNTVTVANVKNNGTIAVSNIVVALYASDMSATVPVNTTTIASLASGATTTLTFVDPTIRNLEGGTVTYTAKVDPDNLITETNEANNNKSSTAKSLKYNGYKGKGIYWEGGSNITTKKTYDLNGGVVYSTQPDTFYKAVGWSSRTESWAASDLPIPSGATIEKVWLYVSYNWDTTSGGVPDVVTTFNGNTITLGTPYIDKSNFGAYADYKYGLYAVDVTTLYSAAGNTLVMTPGSGNSNALYPSTLAVIYRDAGSTRKLIFINEECDELGYSEASYGTTIAEATAFAPFSGMTIDTSKVKSATLNSFAGSAGPGEGNLLFNGASVATNAWQGTASTASAQAFDVKNYLTATGNEAGVQGTTSGGMDALQQILVVEYKAEVPVAGFSGIPTSGTAPLTVTFTDGSSGSITGYSWVFENDGTVDSTAQSPSHQYTTAGTYTVNLTVTGPGGIDSEIKTGYITVSAAPVAPVAAFSATPIYGIAPLSVTFTDTSSNTPTAWNWEYRVSGTSGSWTSYATTQNPTYSFPAGAYDIRLTATNAAGSNTLTKFQYLSVSAGPKRLATVQSGAVSGDLYVGAYQTVAWASQTSKATNTFDQTFSLPAYTNIQWARLYTVVYGSSTDARAGTATVKFDGNGDGTYETTLGIDTLATTSTTAADVYPVNNHVDKQYTDYQIQYDVTSLISSQSPKAEVIATPVDSTFDARIKEVTLVVAYNDGDTDVVKYWVNDGFDFQPSSGSAVTTTFASSSLATIPTIATLTNVQLASSDATYTFNSNTVTGSGTGLPSFAKNVWDVKNFLTAGSDSSFVYTHASSASYKTTLATLTARYTAPVAAFSGTPTIGTAPLTVTFTDGSSGSITGYSWDFENDGTVDSTAQSPSHQYTTAGTYTVNLTVTGPGGIDSEIKTGYITVNAAPVAPVAAFSATPSLLTVQFTDTSSGTITSWLWDFGDGSSTSSDQNPSHTYATAGTYTVTLAVNGGSSSVTQPVVVSDQAIPTPEFPTLALPVMMISAMAGAVIFLKRENEI